MTDIPSGRTDMEKPVRISAYDDIETAKRAGWISDSNESGDMIDRLVAAMNIVERAYQIKLEKPGKNLNHLFEKPGSPAIELVKTVYEQLERNERERTWRDRDD